MHNVSDFNYDMIYIKINVIQIIFSMFWYIIFFKNFFLKNGSKLGIIIARKILDEKWIFHIKLIIFDRMGFLKGVKIKLVGGKIVILRVSYSCPWSEECFLICLGFICVNFVTNVSIFRPLFNRWHFSFCTKYQYHIKVKIYT